MARRSRTPKPPTKAALQREVTRLRKRLDDIQTVAADIYQFLGRANAPLRFMDAGAAIACGWPIKRRELRRLSARELSVIGKEFGTRG